jgi:hypothetical protein
MGCAPSKSVSPAYDAEKQRVGTPARLEVPNGQGGWVTGTVNVALQVENAFRVRIDNKPDAKLMNVILSKPLSSGDAFTNLTSGGDDEDDDEDFTKLMKRLPTQQYRPIDINVIGAGEDGGPKRVRGRVATARVYEGGERLLVLPDASSALCDATVAGPAINAGGGALYKVRMQPGAGGAAPKKPAEKMVDLNDYNHCVQRFDTVGEYEAARQAHLADLIHALGTVEDAITGNKIQLDKQDEAVYITLEYVGDAGTKTAKLAPDWQGLKTMEDL